MNKDGREKKAGDFAQIPTSHLTLALSFMTISQGLKSDQVVLKLCSRTPQGSKELS